MCKPIYSSEEHSAIVEIYLTMCKEFVKDITTQTRYRNYLEVVKIIIEYSNGYGEGCKENGNFYDWLTILPINLSVATNGFFAGVETRNNLAIIRAYRTVLDKVLQETVDKLDVLEPNND